MKGTADILEAIALGLFFGLGLLFVVMLIEGTTQW